MKLRKHQSGFTAAEVVISIGLIGAIGVVFFFAFQANKNTPSATPTPTVSPKPSITPSPSPVTTFKIPELGIQLINVPQSLSDLTYSAGQSGGMDFSTASLTKLSPRCGTASGANGGLAATPGQYTIPTNGVGNGYTFVKQYPAFWVGYSHPQGTCGDDSTSNNLNIVQTAAFQALVTNPDNIQLLKNNSY